MRLLIVEDDPLIGDALCARLGRAGYLVEWVQTGEDALLASRAEQFDLVILDLGLPDMDGFAVLESLRAGPSRSGVLILTAQDGVDERVAGLDGGADDYLVKPFEMAELEARLRSIHRRLSGRAQSRLVVGAVAIDPEGQCAFKDGEPEAVSAKEFALLTHLMENAGRIQPKRRLEGILYGWSDGVESNTLEVYIHQLRRKFGADFIRTVRGLGYVVEKPR